MTAKKLKGSVLATIVALSIAAPVSTFAASEDHQQSSSASRGFVLGSQTESVYGRSKYVAHFKHYLPACGRHDTRVSSDIFGPKEEFDIMYPYLGQMDADIAQIPSISSSVRRKMKPIQEDAQYFIETSYIMREVGQRQVVLGREATEKYGGAGYQERLEDQTEEARVVLEKAERDKKNEARSKLTSVLRSDGSGVPGSLQWRPSSYDKWQDCQGFWSYVVSNPSQATGNGY